MGGRLMLLSSKDPNELNNMVKSSKDWLAQRVKEQRLAIEVSDSNSRQILICNDDVRGKVCKVVLEREEVNIGLDEVDIGLEVATKTISVRIAMGLGLKGLHYVGGGQRSLERWVVVETHDDWSVFDKVRIQDAKGNLKDMEGRDSA
ncbi:hypothetical protein Ancab_001942 [Ancistrocladus abbreviatus]